MLSAAALIHHQHDLGGFDHCRDLISHFDSQVLDALPGDDALDEIFTHPNSYLGGHHSQNNRLDLASQLITRGYLHAPDCSPRVHVSLGMRR